MVTSQKGGGRKISFFVESHQGFVKMDKKMSIFHFFKIPFL